MATDTFCDPAGFRKPILATGYFCPRHGRFRAGAAAPVEAILLRFVPVRFDLYRPLKAHLRWTFQCLIAFADKTGRCFPSLRKLAEVTGLGKSTVGRHLADLEKSGALTRKRRPGGVFSYEIAAKFLPGSRLSHQQDAELSHQREQAVPPVRTEENSVKKSSYPPLDSEGFRWRARMRQWRELGLWVASYGPRPNEPGCRVPRELIS